MHPLFQVINSLSWNVFVMDVTISLAADKSHSEKEGQMYTVSQKKPDPYYVLK